MATMFAFQIHAQIYDTNGEVVQTFVGSQFYGYYDGQGQLTMFNNPSGVVADSSGNLFVLDTGNHRIRKVTTNGLVSTFIGGGSLGPNGASGTNVNFSSYTFNSIAIDHHNTLFVTTGANVWYISTNGLVQTYGNFSVLSSCAGICIDSSNNIYVADSIANKIYELQIGVGLVVFAGSGNPGTVDGNWIFTAFRNPTALASDVVDNIYVFQPSDAASSSPAVIRRINQNRDVKTISGGILNTDSDGFSPGYGAHPVTAMCPDGKGNIILACGNSVRMMMPAGNALSVAGDYNSSGYANGVGQSSYFNGASGVCFSQGSIFVADKNNQRIRQITFNPSSQIVPPANLQLGMFAGLNITGTLGRMYQIQTSPDMTTWSTKATLLLTSSPYFWIDQNLVSGNKYYRAVMLP